MNQSRGKDYSSTELLDDSKDGPVQSQFQEFGHQQWRNASFERSAFSRKCSQRTHQGHWSLVLRRASQCEVHDYSLDLSSRIVLGMPHFPTLQLLRNAYHHVNCMDMAAGMKGLTRHQHESGSSLPLQLQHRRFHPYALRDQLHHWFLPRPEPEPHRHQVSYSTSLDHEHGNRCKPLAKARCLWQ